jgi:hypothetical protein
MTLLLEKTTYIAGCINMSQDKKPFSLAWKVVIAAGILVSLFVGMFTIDNRFAKSAQLTTLETHIDEDVDGKFLLAEAASVKTFQGFQMQQIMMNKAIQLQIFNIQKDSLDREYWKLKREIRISPSDIELQEELSDIKIQRQIIKEKIDKKLLEK